MIKSFELLLVTLLCRCDIQFSTFESLLEMIKDLTSVYYNDHELHNLVTTGE